MESNTKEGDLYGVVTTFGKSFELRYGYYEECDRQNPLCEPIPIYPDFGKTPIYTPDGRPFVTQMQELCEHGESHFEDGCCADCRYYRDGEDLIGICMCEKNKRSPIL